MSKMYYENEINEQVLKGKKIAIIGFLSHPKSTNQWLKAFADDLS